VNAARHMRRRGSAQGLGERFAEHLPEPGSGYVHEILLLIRRIRHGILLMRRRIVTEFLLFRRRNG